MIPLIAGRVRSRFMVDPASQGRLWTLAWWAGLSWLGTAVMPLSAADAPAPLEPTVAEASDEAAEAMAGIRIPEGWKIELFAAEPNVANIVAFDIDNQGRLFVCESYRQSLGVTDNRAHDEAWTLADLAAKTVQDRIDYHKRLLGEAAVTYTQHDDRIRRVVDTDGDGKADESVVLANGFNRIEEGTGAGVLARGSDIYYTCIPKLWKLVDKDDDGVADDRVVLSDGFGVRVAFRGHDMHGLLIGVDGRLYFSLGDRGYHVTTADGRLLSNPAVGAVFRCELDGSNLEVFANGLRNPQELAFNDVGDLFTVDNNSDSGDQARIVQILRGGDSGWRMYYQYLPDRGPFNRERIWYPFENEQPAYIVPPIANFTDGPSGLAYYPGTGFGDSLDDQFLICDFRGGPSNSGIRSFQLQSDGAFYQLASDAQPIWTTLATDLAFGPDGALYVSDWVDGWNGLGKGRIYRLSAPELAEGDVVREVQSLLASDWKSTETDRLVELLAHRDRRIRLEAQWELANRKAAEELLTLATAFESEAATSKASSKSRLHAIWGADHIARIDQEMRPSIVAALRPLLNDPDPIIRAAAAKVAGERGDVDAAPRLIELVGDAEPRVRYHATQALAELQSTPAYDAVVRMIAENNNADPVLRHGGMMYLAKVGDVESVAQLHKHPSEAVRRVAVVALRRRASGEVSKFLADPSPLVVAEAARAIHDEPIPVALSSLAALVSQELEDPELIRRVLSANYRLGTPEAATAVAKYAATASYPEAMRLEALDMLANWAEPDPRDRVINDYRPIAPRSAAIAEKALSAEIDPLMIAQEVIRERAMLVASNMGIKKIAPLLAQRVARPNERPTLKAAALRALAELEPQNAVQLAREFDFDAPSVVLGAVLDVLAKYDAQKSIPRFVKATESSTTQIRQQAWDILAKINDPLATQTILSAVESHLQGMLPGEVELNVLEAASDRMPPELKVRLDEFNAKRAEQDPLAPWLASLNGGSIAKGERLFFDRTELSCVRCHQVERAGGAVGPVLTSIGKTRDRRYLLESICLPNAKIAEGFETTVIVNEDGQVITGIVKSETDDFVELLQADGAVVRLGADEIAARRKGTSSMPADLAKLMTPRELRDMVAYLESRKSSERDTAEVE